MEKALKTQPRECLETITLLYEQQREMYETQTNRIDNRIVSLSQPWMRPIVRGKHNAEVEFGAKIELSDVDGFLRIEELGWDAFNEYTTLKDLCRSVSESVWLLPEASTGRYDLLHVGECPVTNPTIST